MTKKESQKYIQQRRSIRLKEYDYSQAGLYFVTICCKDMACLFGEIIHGEIILNEYGKIAFNEWLKTSDLRKNITLGEFVIMPNHVHIVIHIMNAGELANGGGELHLPIDIESGDTKIGGELHSTMNIETQNRRGELNSTMNIETQNRRGELNSPMDMETGESQFGGEFNSPLHSMNVNPNNEMDEFNSPLNAMNIHPNDEMGECNSPLEIETGENDMGFEYETEGEFNSPLRGPSQTVGAIVRGYKSAVTKQLRLIGFNGKLWQRNYYEHIIRNEKSYQKISEYIINNPSKWSEDKFYM